jgi:hypothetical protein
VISETKEEQNLSIIEKRACQKPVLIVPFDFHKFVLTISHSILANYLTVVRKYHLITIKMNKYEKSPFISSG